MVTSIKQTKVGYAGRRPAKSTLGLFLQAGSTQSGASVYTKDSPQAGVYASVIHPHFSAKLHVTSPDTQLSLHGRLMEPREELVSLSTPSADVAERVNANDLNLLASNYER